MARIAERFQRPLFEGFRTQDEIDDQYRIDAIEPGFGAAVERHARLSAQARRDLDCELDVRYGPTLDETFDYFPAAAGAPLMIFIHGGYWHAPNSAKDFSLVARAAVSRGVSVAVADYSLAPKVTLAEIGRQMRALVAYAYTEGPTRLGIDPHRIIVAGHSAGGQQVAQLLLSDWQGEYGLPADTIRGGVAISGLFDLSPFVYSWLAPRLLLTHDVVRRESPIFGIREVPGELRVCHGARETSEFARQTAVFLAEWTAAGNRGASFELPGCAHMSAFEGYSDAGSILWAQTEELLAS